MNTFVIRSRHLLFKLLTKGMRFPEPVELVEAGKSSEIHTLLTEKRLKKVLIVTDKHLLMLQIIDEVIDSLRRNGIDYIIYNGVQPNPTIANVNEGAAIYKENSCDCIIAFGGGSSIDCAKIIGAKISNKKEVEAMKGLFKIRKKPPFLLAIPTTAGTGSEATLAAVILNDRNEKFVILDPKIMPEAYCLDPLLLKTLPKSLTASTGMDALTHAVEAFIGWHGTEYTNDCAIRATRIIFDCLEKSFEDGDDEAMRMQMLKASNYAGRAFTRASIGYVHAIAHTIGGVYQTPHGLANAVVLPYVLEESKEKAMKKLALMAREIGLGSEQESDESMTEIFINRIQDLRSKLELPDKLSVIRKRDIPYLAERIEKEGNPAYPVPKIMSKKDFIRLLHLIRGSADED